MCVIAGDSASGAAQVAQAKEFLAGPGSTTLPRVWTSDFNSDARRAGVADTCCEAANLDNPQPTLSARIDHVFTRGPWQAVRATLVGASPADKTTTSNLWPSDHAGIVAKLNLQGHS